MTTDAEHAARQTLDAYMAAWNAADNDGVRAALNFPHVMLGPAGQVVVATEPSEIHTDFAALREREGWGSSTLDAFEAVDAMATKVHCKVRFSRYRPDGTKYGSGRMLYIVTNQEGHWGIQLRSGMPDADLLRAREGLRVSAGTRGNDAAFRTMTNGARHCSGGLDCIWARESF